MAGGAFASFMAVEEAASRHALAAATECAHPMYWGANHAHHLALPQPSCMLLASFCALAELTERSEKLAEEGDVDASMAAVAQAERLRK